MTEKTYSFVSTDFLDVEVRVDAPNVLRARVRLCDVVAHPLAWTMKRCEG